ncbi:MAG: hypothetical protein CR991_08225 [Proteobacteria bacterium]|nr:MAG: hypothetical protein CR991_08225 [Pseudomonadota bacterium]
MSTASEQTTTTQATQTFTLSYQQPSDLYQDHLQLFTHLQRDAVHFNGKVKHKLAFREAMACLFAIVSSDYRYVPKDRAAYNAFMQMRRHYQNKGLARAYHAYFDWLFRNDPLAWLILDPIISIQPDAINLEVFSKDEGSYALLSFDHDFFEPQGDIQYGVTNIDFSTELAQAIEQIRSFRETWLTIGQTASQFKVATASDLPDTDIIEKHIQVPNSWIRGFLQVQSAAQLAADVFYLAPLDIYNVLFHLRMHTDRKGKRRGLRIELVPNEQPRLVLEPDDTLITASAAPYQGKQAKIIRLWGRRRLALLKRFLPFAEQIEVHLLGNGMPSFWILRGQGMRLSFAITGFTASNWSQALNFDLLLPRHAEQAAELHTVTQYLNQVYVASLADISKATSLSQATCRAALQQACQQGLITYDPARQVYRYRPLTAEPLDMDQFQFRQPEEALAYDLLERQKAITELHMQLLPHEGVEISAEIKVKEDQREYLSKLRLNEEGHVAHAACSCHKIMQQGLTQGPCSHLLALRLAYAAKLAKRDPSLITQETRIFTRRKNSHQDLIQVTLNHKRLLIQRDLHHQPKQQQFAFNSVAKARQAYLSQIAQLEMIGFIEG